MADALENPVWASLNGRQAHLAVVEGRARRLAAPFGVFAAVGDTSDQSLADLSRLVRSHGEVGLVRVDEMPGVPDTVVSGHAVVCQMVARELKPVRADFEVVALTQADAPQMLALARLTEPGPFLERTHELGDFIGVKVEGRLVAMAGERMRPDGYTEVSGVCTHPDHRGRGYAAGLTQWVGRRILERGETPFLHVYATNTAAITLYEQLGYVRSRELAMTALAPLPA
ncbi:MAG TPA: GNAT family N-acetyltransferase [Caulobacteraceae bacterium]|nr:GNAT family N-acetyltransferase [Caulobacteraceae bacterium]